MIRFRSVLLSLFLCSFSTLHAAIIPFSNQADWESALSSSVIFTEDFSGAASEFEANSLNNSVGLVSVSLHGGEGDPGPTGLTGSGFFQGELDSIGNDALSLEFSFEASFGFALTGLQNDSATKPSALKLDEMALSIGTEYWILSSLAGSSENDLPFLGFVSDERVDSFTLFHAGLVSSVSRTSEEFYLGGFAISTPLPVLSASQLAVSEPPIALIFLAGLSGLYVALKRRKMPSIIR